MPFHSCVVWLALALAILEPRLAQAQARPPAAPAPRGSPQPPAKPPDLKEAPVQPEPPAPAYEKDLLRFSEIIGALAFLRGLCGAADAPEWQKRMQALIEAEGNTPSRKERLAGAYNRGYRGYALTYRVCTPSAQEATARYIAEGEQISRNLAGRFGG